VSHPKKMTTGKAYWLRRVRAAFAATLILSIPVRAAAEKELSGRNAAEADALFTNGVLHILKISIPDKGVRSLRREPRSDVLASLREGATTVTNVSIRLKGGVGSFRDIDDKPGFSLNLANSVGTFHGLKKFHLNNSVQDPTFLSEWICSDIFRQAGVPAARIAHAVVELNGRRLGMYLVVENIGSEFLARYFKHTHGNVYGQRPNADITERLERMGGREDTQWRDLHELAAAVRETNLERLRVRLPQVLDVQRFLSFMAVEVMLDHWDGYTFNVKNYEVYHDLDTDRMVFMPHDLDQMLRDNNEPLMPGGPQGVVARAILRDPQTRAAYRRRFAEVFTNVFVAPVLTRRIDEQVNRLAPQLKNYDPDLASEFVGNRDNLNDRIAGRARGLAAQLKVPEAPRLAFTNGSVLLSGWRLANEQKNAKQELVREPSGKTLLWIAATGPSAASWRAKVMLEPGHYIFEGQARSAGVEPIPSDPKGAGAGLRVSRESPQQAARLVGDATWRKLSFEFDVTTESADVDLICELRAQKGEVWFDSKSLRLLRVN
jgi:hypothetical protein